jgi:hypothetical protein
METFKQHSRKDKREGCQFLWLPLAVDKSIDMTRPFAIFALGIDNEFSETE